MSMLAKKQVYDLAKRAGHSAVKALEIAIDYERGDALTRAWVEILRSTEANKQMAGAQ